MRVECLAVLLKIIFVYRKGETGVECVLRALCETTKVTSLDESVRSPASFANEILRAVFRWAFNNWVKLREKKNIENSCICSLPSESLLSRTKVKTSARAPSYHQASDAGLSTEECSSKYSKCKHSIWDEDFIIWSWNKSVCVSYKLCSNLFIKRIAY